MFPSITRNGEPVALISIAGRAGQRKVVGGIPQGIDASSSTLRSILALTAKYDDTVERVLLARRSDSMTPSEINARVDQLLAPLNTEVSKVVAELTLDRDVQAGAMRSATITNGYEKKPTHQAFFDVRIADAFNELSPVQRAAKLVQLKSNPAVDFDLHDALQRVPGAISRITPQERNELRVSAHALFNQPAHKALDQRRELLELGTDAVRAIADGYRELVGSSTDLHTAVPQVHDLIQSGRLAWTNGETAIQTPTNGAS